MMAKGWIKTWRKIWSSDIWDSKEPFCRRAAWIDLLLMANHEPHTINTKGGPIQVERGQLHTSYQHLADRWHWSRGKVVRFLRYTNEHSMTHTNRHGNGTTVTIENYTFYQDSRSTDGTTDGTTGGTTNGTRTRRKEDIPGRAKGAPGPLRAPDPPMGDPDVIDW